MIAAAYAVELMVSVFQVKLSRLFSSFNFEYMLLRFQFFIKLNMVANWKGLFNFHISLKT